MVAVSYNSGRFEQPDNKMKETQVQKTKRLEEIISRLAPKYPHPITALRFTNSFELLVATVLAAQATDKRVNIVTPTFFPKYNAPAKLLTLGEEKFRTLVSSLNLYKTKSKNILALSKILVEKHHGKVPNIREDLEFLPGVGRKTASVVLANAFHIPAFPVDTHVFRVTRRLGLTNGKNPLEVEKDITALLPEKNWIDAHHYFVFHGREICTAPKPKCSICPLVDICPYTPKNLIPKN